jgi:hypothetical protein
LEGFALDFPDCEITDQMFSGTTEWPISHITMSFTAPNACVDQYLKDHSVEPEDASTWPIPTTGTIDGLPVSPTDPPFGPDAMQKFDFKLDPKRKYTTYESFRTPVKALFKVLLVPRDGGKTSVYMATYSAGNAPGSGSR